LSCIWFLLEFLRCNLKPIPGSSLGASTALSELREENWTSIRSDRKAMYSMQYIRCCHLNHIIPRCSVAIISRTTKWLIGRWTSINGDSFLSSFQRTMSAIDEIDPLQSSYTRPDSRVLSQTNQFWSLLLHSRSGKELILIIQFREGYWVFHWFLHCPFLARLQFTRWRFGRLRI
jgi:hypothetical protein